MNSIGRERSVINTSSSKQMFAFSKASRFPSPKVSTAAFGYDTKSSFVKARPLAASFGCTQHRFGYEEMKKRQRGAGKIDSPDPSSVTALSTKMRTSSYSFGVSRSAMKKLHVDEILKKKDENLPGPDRYDKNSGFGKDSKTI